MTIDLEAIEEQHRAAYIHACVPALVAEVRRLRAVIAEGEARTRHHMEAHMRLEREVARLRTIETARTIIHRHRDALDRLSRL